MEMVKSQCIIEEYVTATVYQRPYTSATTALANSCPHNGSYLDIKQMGTQSLRIDAKFSWNGRHVSIEAHARVDFVWKSVAC
jgi:hypothetical protein